jgi:hypothetical protein
MRIFGVVATVFVGLGLFGFSWLLLAGFNSIGIEGPRYPDGMLGWAVEFQWPFIEWLRDSVGLVGSSLIGVVRSSYRFGIIIGTVTALSPWLPGVLRRALVGCRRRRKSQDRVTESRRNPAESRDTQ